MFWYLKLGSIIVAFLWAGCVFAQEGATIKDVEKLEEQKHVMMEDYPEVFSKVEIKRVEKLDNKHSKVYYTKEASNFEAVVNSDRKDLLLIANCEQIPVKKLPDIVYDSFRESEYGTYKVKKAFIVQRPYSSEFYRLDVYQGDKGGRSYKSIFFTDTGQYRIPPY